jgi:hypothetical protein
MVLASLLTRGSDCEIRSAVVGGGGRTEEGLHSPERGRRAGQAKKLSSMIRSTSNAGQSSGG